MRSAAIKYTDQDDPSKKYESLSPEKQNSGNVKDRGTTYQKMLMRQYGAGGYQTDGGYIGMSSEMMAKPYVPQKDKKKKKNSSPLKKLSATQRSDID